MILMLDSEANFKGKEKLQIPSESLFDNLMPGKFHSIQYFEKVITTLFLFNFNYLKNYSW